VSRGSGGRRHSLIINPDREESDSEEGGGWGLALKKEKSRDVGKKKNGRRRGKKLEERLVTVETCPKRKKR